MLCANRKSERGLQRKYDARTWKRRWFKANATFRSLIQIVFQDVLLTERSCLIYTNILTKKLQTVFTYQYKLESEIKTKPKRLK